MTQRRTILVSHFEFFLTIQKMPTYLVGVCAAGVTLARGTVVQWYTVKVTGSKAQPPVR